MDPARIVVTLLEDGAPPVSIPIKVLESRAPALKVLKDNRTELDDTERKRVLRSGAVWDTDGKKTPGVWKAEIRDQVWYVCCTHRSYRASKSLRAAIRDFDYVKTTA